MTDDKYSSTRGACYIGYITQAISVNLAPLFYLIFQEKFSVTRTQIGQLVFIMFVVQLTVDVLSVYFIKKIGYRRACVISHLFAAAGLVMLSILPSVFSNAYIGILISIIVTSVGSGIIEVMISPIVNSLPNDSGRASMVLLHSFYCWGQALVVLLSTLAMHFLGNDLWNVLPVFWALIPIFNMINFTRVPLGAIEDEEPLRIREFITSPLFILVFIVMICSGASEIAMSQWASYFAEAGLGVTKVVGDILGPCYIHGVRTHRIRHFRQVVESAHLSHRLLCDNRRQLSHRRIFAVSPAVAVRMRALRARRQPSLARRHLACRRTL